VRKISAILVCVFFASFLLSSCGNNRKEQIDKACTLVDFAWDTYSKGFLSEVEARNLNIFSASEQMSAIATQYIPETTKYLNEAGMIFRDLSASDSGFAEYATAAFTTAQLTAFWWGRDDGFESAIDSLYYFCGSN
jgi:hypothetical protein